MTNKYLLHHLKEFVSSSPRFLNRRVFFIFLFFFQFTSYYTIDAQNLTIDSTLGYQNAQTVAAEMIQYEDVEKTAYTGIFVSYTLPYMDN